MPQLDLLWYAQPSELRDGPAQERVPGLNPKKISGLSSLDGTTVLRSCRLRRLLCRPKLPNGS